MIPETLDTRPVVKGILDEFFSRKQCPSYEQFKAKIIPVFAKNRLTGPEINIMLIRFREEWWRVKVEFDKDWGNIPSVTEFASELEHLE